jgi:hypothetical protein
MMKSNCCLVSEITRLGEIEWMEKLNDPQTCFDLTPRRRPIEKSYENSFMVRRLGGF